MAKSGNHRPKALIVVERLKSPLVGELRNEHQINRAKYYRWCDQFLGLVKKRVVIFYASCRAKTHKLFLYSSLANALLAFETKQVDAKVERLEQENAKLKVLVVEVILDLKKSEEVLERCGSIACGGVVTNPGDLVVADRAGIVIVPHSYAPEFVKRLEAGVEQAEAYQKAVQYGDFSNAWVDALLERSGCLVDGQPAGSQRRRSS